MLTVAKALGRLALLADFVPREFTRKEAGRALFAIGEPSTRECDPIERLRLNSVQIEKEGGLDTRLRFMLDPIAEFLAAAYSEECGSDHEKWSTLLEQAKMAPGFQSALKLVRHAYGPK